MTKRHNSEKSTANKINNDNQGTKQEDRGKIVYFPVTKSINQSKILTLFWQIFGNEHLK